MPPARFAPDLGIQVPLWSRNDVITSWLRLRLTSYRFPHPSLTYTKCLSHWYAVSMAFGCTHMPLHKPSWPQNLGILGHLWSENDVIMSYLRLTYTSDHIQSIGAISMLSQVRNGASIPLHWPSWPQIWEFWVTLVEWE